MKSFLICIMTCYILDVTKTNIVLGTTYIPIAGCPIILLNHFLIIDHWGYFHFLLIGFLYFSPFSFLGSVIVLTFPYSSKLGREWIVQVFTEKAIHNLKTLVSSSKLPFESMNIGDFIHWHFQSLRLGVEGGAWGRLGWTHWPIWEQIEAWECVYSSVLCVRSGLCSRGNKEPDSLLWRLQTSAP